MKVENILHENQGTVMVIVPLWAKFALAGTTIAFVSLTLFYYLQHNDASENGTNRAKNDLLVATILTANVIDGIEQFLDSDTEPNKKFFQKFIQNWSNQTAIPDDLQTNLQLSKAEWNIVYEGQNSAITVLHLDNSGLLQRTVLHADTDLPAYEQLKKELANAGPRHTRATIPMQSGESGNQLQFSAPIRNADGQHVASLLLKVDQQHLNAKSNPFDRWDILLLISITLIAGLWAGLFGYLISKPIKKLSKASSQMLNGKTPSNFKTYNRRGIAPDESHLIIDNILKMYEDSQALMLRLKKIHHKLQRSDRTKSVFLQLAAHELRTPLNSLSMIKLLPEIADHDDETSEIINCLILAYDRLEQFLLSAEEYIYSLAHDPIPGAVTNISLELQLAVHNLQAKITSNKLQIELDIPDEKLRVGMPENLVNYTVFHLLDNAIKFSRPGNKIVCGLRKSGAYVTLSVRDFGQGIGPEDINRILEPFYVGNITHHSKGTGVHLATVHEYLQTYKGAIHISSDGPNLGSNFTVEIPAAELSQASSSSSPPAESPVSTD